MKAVVSRVDAAAVSVEGAVVGRVAKGLLIYLGIMEGDTGSDLEWMTRKLLAMRVFNDAAGKMNLSVQDVGGGMLLIPNFTLAGVTSKGTRPSYSQAAPPGIARPMFEQAVAMCSEIVPVGAGVFGAHMLIHAECNGPVTLIIDSRL